MDSMPQKSAVQNARMTHFTKNKMKRIQQNAQLGTQKERRKTTNCIVWIKNVEVWGPPKQKVHDSKLKQQFVEVTATREYMYMREYMHRSLCG